jgi:drug/metabolite transporter (DMT)-like permease
VDALALWPLARDANGALTGPRGEPLALGRVSIAAALPYPFFRLNGGDLPTSLAGWKPFFVMGTLNNIFPFSLIFAGQTYITGGLASVLNATPPLFVLMLASFGDEKLIAC